MLGSFWSGWGIDPCPLTLYNTLSSTDPNPMSSWSPCSDLATRQIKWISRGDQIKNGSRPGSYVAWGISAVSIAAQYAETHADRNRKCPISGWRSSNWG